MKSEIHTSSIQELLHELVLGSWVHQIWGHPIIVIRGCEHVFRVTHDIQNLKHRVKRTIIWMCFIKQRTVCDFFRGVYPGLGFEVRLVHHVVMEVSCKDAWRRSLLQIEQHRPVLLQPWHSVPVWHRQHRSQITLAHDQRNHLLHPCCACGAKHSSQVKLETEKWGLKVVQNHFWRTWCMHL